MVEPIPLFLPSESPDPFLEDELRLIDRLLDEQLVDVSYQPIVDLKSRSIFAYEALARPRDGYFRTPEELLDSAVRTRSMGRLGRHLRTLAIHGCQRWPLFINLNPHEFGDPYLVQPDEPLFMTEHPVYLEISEAVPTEFFDQCHSVLAELRKKSILLAIDDFGAGASSLRYIVELEPDIVKLDRELIIGCLPDSREYHLLRSLTDLCHRMNATVIAEGIETVEELKACIAAGIDYGQGFLLSVPSSPPPSFYWPPELPADSTSLLEEFQPYGSSDPDRAGTPQTGSPTSSPTGTEEPDAELVSARITIQRLEDQLAEVRTELAATLEERTILSQRLKRLSHSSEASPGRERRRIAGREPEQKPTASVSRPTGRNGDDATDFLRQIEAERAAGSRSAGNGS